MPPHNLEMEENLLGSMLLTNAAIHTADAFVDQTDFYKPAHGHVFAAIMACYERGEKVDISLVADELRERGLLDALGGKQTLARLQAGAPVSAHAQAYADVVARHARRRRAIGFAGDLAEIAYDESRTLDDVVALAEQIPDRLVMPHQMVEPGVDAYELAEMQFEYKWIVPGLIQRRDRIMLTGLEGHSGKTEFLVQLGLQFASGIHPWTRSPEFEPLRVLHVDCENRLDQLQPRVQRLLKIAHHTLKPGQWTTRAVDEINVRTPKGAGLLDALCELHKPDVLVTGPLYAMFQGSHGMAKHSEEVAEEVAAFFRRLIARHDCALLLEAHSPHGNEGDRAGLRPIGASLWLRWPEVGVGLRPKQVRDQQSRKLVVVPGEFAFEFWRGTRDQDLRRPWPTGVRRWRDWSFIPIDDSEVF